MAKLGLGHHGIDDHEKINQSAFPHILRKLA